jgi:hypothetical protein
VVEVVEMEVQLVVGMVEEGVPTRGRKRKRRLEKQAT